MIIAVDAGNSRVRVALFRHGRLERLLRLPSDPGSREGRLPLALERLLRAADVPDTEVRIGLSSVVPALTGLLEAALARWGPVARVEPGVAPGITVGYADPEQLGADRLANAVAAAQAYGCPCLVADLGTALTVDVVDGECTLRGGVIFPGMEAARAALNRSTAQIQAPCAPPAGPVGRNTREGVAAGLVYGYNALLGGLLVRLRQEVGSQAPAVLTGGGAWALVEPVPGVDAHDPYLTLRGIALFAAQGA